MRFKEHSGIFWKRAMRTKFDIYIRIAITESIF